MNFWSFLKYLTTPTTSLLPFKIQNISFVVHASGISIELLITKIKLVECERVHHPYNVQYNSLNGHPLRLAYIEYLSPWQLYTISLIQSISRLVTTRICCTLLLVWQKRAVFLPPRRARDKGIFDVRPSGLVKELSNVQFLSDFCQIFIPTSVWRVRKSVPINDFMKYVSKVYIIKDRNNLFFASFVSDNLRKIPIRGFLHLHIPQIFVFVCRVTHINFELFI